MKKRRGENKKRRGGIPTAAHIRAAAKCEAKSALLLTETTTTTTKANLVHPVAASIKPLFKKNQNE